MFGKKKIFGKEANEEGVQFDFSNNEDSNDDTSQNDNNDADIDLSQGDEANQDDNINDNDDSNDDSNSEDNLDDNSEDNQNEDDDSNDDSQSSLNTEDTSDEDDSNTENDEVVVPEVTEEMILKSLSEKLGREVTSFDDLTPNDPLAGNEYVKGLLEWQNKTGRPIEDYVKYQKDFSEVLDIDIAREFLQIKYPTFTADEIQFELERNFIAGEDDLDSDIKAKSIDLKKFASEGRNELNKLRMDLGKPNPQAFTAEVQAKLDWADQVQSQIEANGKDQEAYDKAAKTAVSTVGNIELPLAEGVKLDFKVETSKDVLTGMVMDATHWKDANGQIDHNIVARDAAILANFENMLKLAYEQGVSAGTDEVIKDTKNTTLDSTVRNNSADVNNSKGMVVEGLDKFLGKGGMSIKRFKK